MRALVSVLCTNGLLYVEEIGDYLQYESQGISRGSCTIAERSAIFNKSIAKSSKVNDARARRRAEAQTQLPYS